jgi:hypothetical protein
MTSSLYMQFDPLSVNAVPDTDHYDASDVLTSGAAPTAYADVDDAASSSAGGGAYYDAPSNSDGYSPTPMLTGSHRAAGESRASLASSTSHSSTGSASLLSPGHRAWNREHQELVKHPNWYQKYPQIAALTQQFQETAYVYGRLIISERALAPDARSIKPIHIGGVAGGDKYLHNGILFKFATDPVIAELNGRPVYLFGGQQPSDEKAIKAMSRELLGADRYWGAFQDELHYPMMCLIDHKGFRMLAMAVLPISHDTIVYGSADGGRTVHSADPAINAVMEKVGKALNLKGHYVGLNEQHLIYGAGDVEVHRGTDGRHYVVDFARCSAPEAPPHLGDRRTVFSRLLRPEFTRAYKKPLCADAFTRWDANRDDAVVHAQDVVDATQYLYDQVVPAVARRIEQDVAACNVSLDISDQIKAAGGHPKHRFKFDPDFPLLGVTDRPPAESGLHAGGVDDDDDDLDASVSGVLSAPRPVGRRVARLVADQLECLSEIVVAHQLHKEGINVRHLGRVRAATTDARARTVILSSCVARVLKMQLNERMREEMRQLSLPADMPFKAVVCKYLAQMMVGFGGDQSFDTKVARYFWRDELKRELNARFEHALSADESAPDFDLRQCVHYKLVYYIFLKLTGIKISDKAGTHLWKSETSSFAINRYDIEDVGSRSHMTQTYYVAAGISTLLYALETDDSDGGRTVRRMLHSAFEQLRGGYHRASEGGLPLVYMAICVSEIASRKRRRNRRNVEWRRAELWWDRANKTWPGRHVLGVYITCLEIYRDRVASDLAKLEERYRLLAAPVSAEGVARAHERAQHYLNERRRSSTTSLTSSTSSSAATAPAAASSSSSSSSLTSSTSSQVVEAAPATPPPPSPLARSLSRVLPFEPFVRPMRKTVHTVDQLVSCNVTSAVVAIDDERKTLARLTAQIEAAKVEVEKFPPFDHSIVKAFRFTQSALNRNVCTPMPSGMHAINTRPRRHYDDGDDGGGESSSDS